MATMPAHLSPSGIRWPFQVCTPNLHAYKISKIFCREGWKWREYSRTSSLEAWRTAAFESGPQSMHALGDVFLSLVVATDEDLQSRRAMETTMRSQIDAVFAATEELRGYFEQIMARSEQLEKFDELARKSLEHRRLRYEQWRTWRFDQINSTSALRLKYKSRNSPAPSESTMVAAYDLADMEVRRHVSKAEVARCSFKDKAIEEVDAISFTYQGAIDAIAKCLKLLAENQQECASSASIGASRIVKVASDISGLRIAGPFHGELMSEAQNIPITSTPYVDLEWNSRYPTVQSQPIMLGFSLPPRYFSCTASCSVVVNVFSQLVSFICDCQAWDKYITGYIPTDKARTRELCELERSWTRNDDRNRDLLRSVGPSVCADLIKTLLVSFPEPLVNCSDALAENLRLLDLEDPWAGPRNQDDANALVPLVEPLYDRPQGEMLRALCDSLVPVFRVGSQIPREIISEIFSGLLTRKGDRLKCAFPVLVRKFSTVITIINNKNSLPPTRKPFPISDLQIPRADPPPYAPNASTSQLVSGDENPTTSPLRQYNSSPMATPSSRDRALPSLPLEESMSPASFGDKSNFWTH